jgi:hypothetical protein
MSPARIGSEKSTTGSFNIPAGILVAAPDRERGMSRC